MYKFLLILIASSFCFSRVNALALESFESLLKEASQKGDFQNVIEARLHPEKRIPKGQQQHYEFELQKLEEERNKALLQIVDSSDLEICRTLKRLTNFHLNHSQHEALKYMEALRSKALNSSISPLENKLIALDLEYQCKDLFVDKMFDEGRLNATEKRGMKVLFKIERMQKMLLAAGRSHERSLARLVEDADQVFSAYCEYQADLAILEALASGAKEPANPIEAKAKEVFNTYQNHAHELKVKYLYRS